MQKIQFAKTLISKQVDVEKLKQIVDGKNLIDWLASEALATSAPQIQVDVLELLVEAGVNILENGCAPLVHACKMHNLALVKEIMRILGEKFDSRFVKNLVNSNTFANEYPMSALFSEYTKSNKVCIIKIYKILHWM